MGWGSGADVMELIIAGLKKSKMGAGKRQEVYEIVIPALQAHDWDTEQDCMDEDPAYDKALRKLCPEMFEEEE